METGNLGDDRYTANSYFALVEEGLQRVLGQRKRPEPFRLRKASFRGEGLQPEVGEGSWERIRDRVYEGRGA